MKLLPELYSDAMKMWQSHHADIMEHLTQVAETVLSSAAGGLPLVQGVTVAENVLEPLVKRIEALEAKLSSTQG